MLFLNHINCVLLPALLGQTPTPPSQEHRPRRDGENYVGCRSSSEELLVPRKESEALLFPEPLQPQDLLTVGLQQSHVTKLKKIKLKKFSLQSSFVLTIFTKSVLFPCPPHLPSLSCAFPEPFGRC